MKGRKEERIVKRRKNECIYIRSSGKNLEVTFKQGSEFKQRSKWYKQALG